MISNLIPDLFPSLPPFPPPNLPFSPPRWSALGVVDRVGAAAIQYRRRQCILLLLVLIRLLLDRRIRHARRWARPRQSIVPCLASPTFLEDMMVIGDNAWIARIRLKRASFLALCRWLDKNTQLQATCAKSRHPLEGKVLLFLWMTSQGTTFRATATLFRVSWSTAHLLVIIFYLVIIRKCLISNLSEATSIRFCVPWYS